MQKEAIVEKFEIMKKKGKINEKTLKELGLKPSQSMNEKELKSSSMKNQKTSESMMKTERSEP